jgi:hypothetical protein
VAALRRLTRHQPQQQQQQQQQQQYCQHQLKLLTLMNQPKPSSSSEPKPDAVPRPSRQPQNKAAPSRPIETGIVFEFSGIFPHIRLEPASAQISEIWYQKRRTKRHFLTDIQS